MAVKVAYLFGAGASEGALIYSGASASSSILMKNLGLDIAETIEDESILAPVKNDLVVFGIIKGSQF